jgi:hypothetical protein
MIRVFLAYEGRDYTLADRTADEVCEEIERKLASGAPAWLTVSTGEGRFQEARLLLQPGVSIAVIPIDEVGRHQDGRQLSRDVHGTSTGEP